MKLPSFNLKSLKKLFTRKPKISGGMYDAKRDWKIMLFSFAVLSLALACVSGYLFYKINNGEVFLVEQKENGSVEAVNKKNLDETVDRFEAKKAKLLELEQNMTVVPDPSI